MGVRGVDASIFVQPTQLHLTLAMLRLTPDTLPLAARVFAELYVAISVTPFVCVFASWFVLGFSVSLCILYIFFCCSCYFNYYYFHRMVFWLLLFQIQLVQCCPVIRHVGHYDLAASAPWGGHHEPQCE